MHIFSRARRARCPELRREYSIGIGIGIGIGMGIGISIGIVQYITV